MRTVTRANALPPEQLAALGITEETARVVLRGRRAFYKPADPFLGMWYACLPPLSGQPQPNFGLFLPSSARLPAEFNGVAILDAARMLGAGMDSSR